MSTIPFWAVPPKHQKKVVATERGWVVEETGELLVSLRGLSTRLRAYLSEVSKLSEVIQDIVPEAQEEAPVIELVKGPTQVPEVDEGQPAPVNGPTIVTLDHDTSAPVEELNSAVHVFNETPVAETEVPGEPQEQPKVEEPVTDEVTAPKKRGRKSNAEKAAIAAAQAEEAEKALGELDEEESDKE